MSLVKKRTDSYEMCIHMCSACITQAPSVPLSQKCFPSTYFFLFIVPATRAICSKVWNCDEWGFAVCSPLSAGGEQFFSNCTHGTALFSLIQTTNENTSCLFWQASLFLPWRHQATLCRFFVFRYLIVLLIPLTAPMSVCRASRNTRLSRASTWVHANCEDPLCC